MITALRGRVERLKVVRGRDVPRDVPHDVNSSSPTQDFDERILQYQIPRIPEHLDSGRAARVGLRISSL